MPRRASSGLHPGLILAAILVIGGAFFAGSLFFSEEKAVTLEGPRLDMNDVAENANALRGNRYVVEGSIDDQLVWTPDAGQLISLRVKDASSARFLPIEIPAALAGQNIEREQNYAFRIRFRDGGIAVAEEILNR